MKTILISGGAGYLGSILVQKLLQAKDRYIRDPEAVQENPQHYINFDKIIVYDNLSFRQVCLTDYCYRGDFEFVKGDVRDWEKFKVYVEQADIIIPLAAIVGMPACQKDPKLAEEINYQQIANILSIKKPHQKLIFPNTNSGYGIGEKDVACTEESPLKPISVYGTTKCRAENLILSLKEGITLRLATVFGVSPRQRLDLLVNDFVYKSINDGYLVLFEKDFKRNFIHIHDVAMAFIFMINNYEKYQGNAFNVGLSNANLSKIELAEKIKSHIPDLVIKTEDFKSDPDKRDYIVSNEKLESTGWKSHYSLDDGINELIKAYAIIQHSNRKYTNL